MTCKGLFLVTILLAFSLPPHASAAPSATQPATHPQTAPAPVESMRIVYVLDHGPTIRENFAPLQLEMRRAIGGLIPSQKFALIVFSADAVVLGGKTQLQLAIPNNKAAIFDLLDKLPPEDPKDKDAKASPQEAALTAAFALDPDLIYFITDRPFDPKLLDTVTALNKNRHTRINTIAYVNQDNREYQVQLMKLAAENHGKYRFVDKKHLTPPATRPSSRPRSPSSTEPR